MGGSILASDASFDHVHILTDDVEGMVTAYKEVFGAKELRRLPRGDAYMVHLALGGARIVVSPADGPGTKVDHIAVTTPALEATAEGIVAKGGQVVRPLTEAGPFRVLFVRDAAGLLIELVDPPTA